MKKSLAVYLLVVAAFLGVQAMQGLSFLDIGMYMSGYEHFPSDPGMTAYLGQWIATYLLTGQILAWTDANSFMALRVMHIALLLCLQAVIFLSLRRYLRERILFIGLTLATLAHFGSYLDINYNDYSTTLLVLIILTVHRGLFAHRRSIWLLMAGVLTGFSFYFRIVNITFLLLPFLGLLLGKRYRLNIPIAKYLLVFGSGMLAGCLLMTGYLWVSGGREMLAVWTFTLNCLFSMGTDSADPHSLKAVAIGLYTTYKAYFTQACVEAGFLLLLTIASCKLQRTYKLLAVVTLGACIIVNIYLWEPIGGVMGAFCLLGLVALIAGVRLSPETDVLFLLSLFVPLVYPIGSNGGLDFLGQCLFFLPLPLAMAYLFELPDKLPQAYRHSFSHALHITIGTMVITLLFVNVKRPMMEEGNRLECRYTVESPLTHHIYTTRANADLHNRLLKELKPLVPKGSYMVCNFSLPLISMLECKPYAVFSDVFTSDQMNLRYISIAEKGLLTQEPTQQAREQQVLMLVDRQSMTDGFESVCRRLCKSNGYKTVWSDGRYELWKR